MLARSIPVVVGVTGHRNIVDEDKPAIKEQVKSSLLELQALCRSKAKGGSDTPVVMLNGFAQGADMLCAEAAFELGIDVYAVLPREEEKYLESFDDGEDKQKLHAYLAKAKRVIIAPDIEQNKQWLQDHGQIDDESYEYRQLGIYIAEHSHILIALWDGKPPKTQFGCGTVEVIKFALEHKYLNNERLFSPGSINDAAVIWIKSRRQGDPPQEATQRIWLTSDLARQSGVGDAAGSYAYSSEPPAMLKEIIAKTVKYNERPFSLADDKITLWKDFDKLDDYRKSLRYHYAKADDRSYNGNQTKYTLFLKLLAIFAALVALTFMIYDDAGLPFMIFPCTGIIVTVIVLNIIGKRKSYHGDYIDYRAFAEALRIQFYLSICTGEYPITNSVCELYSWAQKVDFVWIDKALRSLAVVHESEQLKIDPSEAIETWIGLNGKPTGQLKYHRTKIATNAAIAKKYDMLSKCMLGVTISLYAIILLMETVTYICSACGVNFFWGGEMANGFSWRNLGAILLGTIAATSLLLSSYWGKLSYDRKANDNEKMCKFYAAAYDRWQDVKDRNDDAKMHFVKEIAREEIVENGIWYSYVNENRLEIDI